MHTAPSRTARRTGLSMPHALHELAEQHALVDEVHRRAAAPAACPLRYSRVARVGDHALDAERREVVAGRARTRAYVGTSRQSRIAMRGFVRAARPLRATRRAARGSRRGATAAAATSPVARELAHHRQVRGTPRASTSLYAAPAGVSALYSVSAIDRRRASGSARRTTSRRDVGARHRRSPGRRRAAPPPSRRAGTARGPRDRRSRARYAWPNARMSGRTRVAAASRYCAGVVEARAQHRAQRAVAEEEPAPRAAARRAAPCVSAASSVGEQLVPVEQRRGTPRPVARRATSPRASAPEQRRPADLARQRPPPASRGCFASRIARSAICSTAHSKYVGRERVDVHVRRRVHEVDRVRHAVADRELHRVHVVAERAHERARVAARCASPSSGDEVVVRRRCTSRAFGSYFIGSTSCWPRHDAADEVVPLDELLHDHREQARTRCSCAISSSSERQT